MSRPNGPTSGIEVIDLFQRKFGPMPKPQRHFLVELVDATIKQCSELAQQEVLTIAKRLAKGER